MKSAEQIKSWKANAFLFVTSPVNWPKSVRGVEIMPIKKIASEQILTKIIAESDRIIASVTRRIPTCLN